MTDSNLKILLVDDEPLLTEMHSALLEKNGYSVLAAEDGEQAKNILDDSYKDIGVIISDITMPNMNGYDFCSYVKANELTKDIPVIFVSALSSLEEKIKGYEVGADDYIIKPVTEDELCRKINTLVEIRKKQQLLSDQVVESRNMAMQAMTFSNELGQVIEFYKQVLNSKDYSEITQYYLDIAASFQLTSLMQVITPEQVLNVSSSGIASPLEINVIELARGKGRFFDFGARTIVNYDTFSLLIKNMPLDDVEKYGRLKDILGMIGNGIEAKIQQLNHDLLNKKKEEIFISIKESISSIEASFAELQKENITAIEDMNEQIHEANMTLGLTETQENNIQRITEACLERSSRAFYKGVSIEENLKNIYQQFHYALGVKP